MEGAILPTRLSSAFVSSGMRCRSLSGRPVNPVVLLAHDQRSSSGFRCNFAAQAVCLAPYFPQDLDDIAISTAKSASQRQSNQMSAKRASLTSGQFVSSRRVPLPETGRSDRSSRPFVVAQHLLTSEQVSDDGVFVPQWVLCASRRRAAVSILQKVYRALSYADSVKIAADIVGPCGQ